MSQEIDIDKIAEALKNSEHEYQSGWHVDKRINVSVVAMLLIQSIVLAFWLGALGNRVTNLETTTSLLTELVTENTSNRFTDADAVRLENRIAEDIGALRVDINRNQDAIEELRSGD